MKRKINILIAALVLMSFNTQAQQLWKPLINGLPGEVLATCSNDRVLYALHAGKFTENGRTYGIGIWDGNIWRQLPTFTSDSSARFSAIEEYKGHLYIGGRFNKINRIENSSFIFRWNGKNYEAVHGSVPGNAIVTEISSLAAHEDQLCIGGGFFNLFDLGDQNMVRFDGEDFSNFEIEQKKLDARVSHLLKKGDTLYVGGHFNVSRNEDISSVFAIQKGEIIKKFTFDFKVLRMAFSESQQSLIVAAIDSNKNIGLFRLKDKTKLDSGLNTLFYVNDLHEYQGRFILSGFAELSNQQSSGILFFSNGQWQKSPGSELVNIRWLETFRNKLIVAGNFKSFGTVDLNHIAQMTPDAGYVSGRIYIDRNANCQFDARDQIMPYALVQINPGSVYVRSDLFGNYRAFLPQGNYSISVITPRHLNVSACSDEIISVTINEGQAAVDQDFPLSVKDNFRDLKIEVFSNQGFKATRGNTQQLFVTYRNNGSLPSGKGTVKLKLPESVNLISAKPEVDSSANNLLVWNFSDLNPEDERVIRLEIEVPAGIPDGQIQYISSISSAFEDDFPLDNQSNMEQIISATEQYNEKQVMVQNGGVGINSLSYVHSETDELNYYINFGNYSEDTIYNMVVIDTIDLNLDMRYFQITGSSHNWSYDIINGPPGSNIGIFIWYFNNINLAPNPNKIFDIPGYGGFVSFKIGMKQKLDQGTRIRNAAQIMYDYHSSFLTNEVWCEVNDMLSTSSPQSIKHLNTLSLYPNPAQNTVHIDIPEHNGILYLRDLNGKNIYTMSISQEAFHTVTLDKFQAGLYIVTYLSEQGIWNNKLLIQK